MEDTTAEIHVLLIEDDAGDALLVQEMLAESETPAFVITHVDRFSVARQRLQTGLKNLADNAKNMMKQDSRELVERFAQMGVRRFHVEQEVEKTACADAKVA